MATYLLLLRKNPNFRRLWLATVISYLGDWFNLLASAALIGHLTSSGAAVSYLFLARLLPLFFFSPWTGTLADRFNRKRLMMIADLLRAVTVLCYILVQWTGNISLLYLLTVVQFALSALFQPAHAALIPNIVDGEDLVTANALDGFTWSSMLAFGSLLGGIATTLFGITACFVIDAASFLWSAFFISRIVVAARPVAASTSQRLGLLAFVDGLAYLRTRVFLLCIVLVKAGGGLFWGASDVLQVPIAREIFPIGENGTITLALFYTMIGLGSGLGPLWLTRILGDRLRSNLFSILLGFVLSVIGLYWLSVAGGVLGATLAVLLRSFGGGLVWVYSTTIWQRLANDEFRGRVASFEFTALTLFQSLGTLWAGYAQDVLQYSLIETVRITALVPLLVTLLWGLFVWKVGALNASKTALEN
ncbi:MAG: MFS transporter [Caldilineaceae bacterium]